LVTFVNHGARPKDEVVAYSMTSLHPVFLRLQAGFWTAGGQLVAGVYHTFLDAQGRHSERVFSRCFGTYLRQWAKLKDYDTLSYNTGNHDLVNPVLAEKLDHFVVSYTSTGLALRLHQILFPIEYFSSLKLETSKGVMTVKELSRYWCSANFRCLFRSCVDEKKNDRLLCQLFRSSGFEVNRVRTEIGELWFELLVRHGRRDLPVRVRIKELQIDSVDWNDREQVVRLRDKRSLHEREFYTFEDSEFPDFDVIPKLEEEV
jgi:hypothetical protein